MGFIVEGLRGINEMQKTLFSILGAGPPKIGDSIAWESWNLDGSQGPDNIMKTWTDRMTSVTLNLTEEEKKKIKVAFSFTINDDMHIDAFPFIYEAVWKWINQEFYSKLSGILTFHFKNDRFIVKVLVNPFPFGSNYVDIFHLNRKDSCLKNNYYTERDSLILKNAGLYLGEKNIDEFLSRAIFIDEYAEKIRKDYFGSFFDSVEPVCECID